MIVETVHAPTTSPDVLDDTPSPPKVVSAFYSLVFPNFTFYIQTLSVTIGRRCSSNPNAATSSAPSADSAQVDVDLGALKSVSRLHAKIEYDSEQDRFVLAVLGRNGAWVDGVWSGSGTRAALGERSQIQIASRIFEFVLPPPPPPDESPSPGALSSSAIRQRSPSLDITSISPPSSQPSHTPPPIEDRKPKLILSTPPRPSKLPPEPSLPNTNSISRSTKSKKRRKNDSADLPASVGPVVEEKPPPDQIPPKPTYTYAQLIYRALKVLHKATLNEICNWIMNEFPYYRFIDGQAWMSSVRHNLSSNRAFKKLEKCGGDRGKGNFWSLDEDNAHIIEEQEAKALQAAAQATTKGKKKEKGTPLTEPPLKRSVKGDAKGVLPPPLTSAPLTMHPKPSPIGMSPTTSTITVTAPTTTTTAPPASSTSVFSYHNPFQTTTGTSGYSGTPMSGPNPYAALTQSNWRAQSKVTPIPVLSTVANSPAPVVTPTPPPATLATTGFPDVPIPIILGPIPPSHPDYSPSHTNNSAREGYMILHERKLVLDPSVFSDLTKDIIADLEKMGSRQALDVLTGHMVRVLKERRRAKKKGTARARGGKNPGGVKRKEPGDALSLAVTPALPPVDEDAIVVIDDDDDPGPVAKKRKVNEHLVTPTPIAVDA